MPSGNAGPPGKSVSEHHAQLAEETNVSSGRGNDIPFDEEVDLPLNSWTVIHQEGKRNFCRCRRGPMVMYCTFQPYILTNS